MKLDISVSATPDEVADLVRHRLLGVIASVQAEGGIPHVALTGGSVASVVHRAIAAAPEVDRVDWSRVELWWGDERFVPAGDPDRNAQQAYHDLLGELPLDPDRVHPMPASDSGMNVGAAATSYAEELRAHGGAEFDVVMLGMGDDGHVASLFPHQSGVMVEDELAIAVTDAPKPPAERISLTLPALNRSRETWMLVTGATKAAAVAQATSSTASTAECPAAGVEPRRTLRWFLDEPAAARLD